MVKINFLIVLSFLTIFLIGIVSANGLTITQGSSFTTNKTYDSSSQITFTLKNEEPFSFYDILFEENSQIEMSKIDELASGEEINITADIISNSDFSGDIKLKGFYDSDTGELNETHNIEVNYNTGLSRCDFSIIKGDSVEWKNTHPYANIKLVNADTTTEVAQLTPNQTYLEKFQTPMVFKYYFERYGIRFTDICSINVLDTSGRINNPDLDAILNLNVNIEYPPTNLIVTILETNYEISPGESVEDFLKIENNGTEIAKNIHLSGDWFVFTGNDFDLQPGYSKTIKYEIFPDITKTNETDETYQKKVTITGNFEPIERNFDIFIPYTNIGSDFFDDSKTFSELIEERIEFAIVWCNENPDEEICDELVETIVVGGSLGNGSSSNLELGRAFIDFMDKQEQQNALEKQNQDSMNQKIDGYLNQSDTILSKLTSIESSDKSNKNATIFFAMVVAFFVVVAVCFYFIKHFRNKNKFMEGSQYY